MHHECRIVRLWNRVKGTALIGVDDVSARTLNFLARTGVRVSRFSIIPRAIMPEKETEFAVFSLFRRSTLRIKTNSSKYLLFERFLSLFHRRPTFRYAFFRGVVFCSALRSAFARAVQETQATQKSFAYLYKALAPLALHLSLSISNRSL